MPQGDSTCGIAVCWDWSGSSVLEFGFQVDFIFCVCVVYEYQIPTCTNLALFRTSRSTSRIPSIRPFRQTAVK